MAPICQAFVENTWKKDICSNCFKTEGEHGTADNEYDYTLKRNYSSDVGQRYLGYGTAGRCYSRSYYGSSAWNGRMLDNSNEDSRLLKSPALIRGVNSIINQENTKNTTYNNNNNQSNKFKSQAFILNDESNRLKIPTSISNDSCESTEVSKDSWIRQIIESTASNKYSEQSNHTSSLLNDNCDSEDSKYGFGSKEQDPREDSWPLTQIIKDTGNIKENDKLDRFQGDSSSDLGSEASLESSTNNSGSSEPSESSEYGSSSRIAYDRGSEVELKRDSDRGSIKSDPSDHESNSEDESSKVRISFHPYLLESTDNNSNSGSDFKILEKGNNLQGILKKNQSGSSKSCRISIKDIHEVIGYGGELNSSFDEVEIVDYVNDDDSQSECSDLDLNEEEEYLKKLTENLTNFNSEKKNLEKDLTNEEREKLTEINRVSSLDEVEKQILKTESQLDHSAGAKIKLKRSQPILSLKPAVKSSLLSNQKLLGSLSSQTEIARESFPLQGIKPTYVSKENEMRENSYSEDMYTASKVTSFDDNVTNFDEKITNFDRKITDFDEIATQITSIDDFNPPKNTHESEVLDTPSNRLDTLVSTTTVSSSLNVRRSPKKRSSKITNIDDALRLQHSDENVIKIKTKTDEIVNKECVQMSNSSEKNLEVTRKDLRSESPANEVSVNRRSSFMESQLGNLSLGNKNYNFEAKCLEFLNQNNAVQHIKDSTTKNLSENETSAHNYTLQVDKFKSVDEVDFVNKTTPPNFSASTHDRINFTNNLNVRESKTNIDFKGNYTSLEINSVRRPIRKIVKTKTRDDSEKSEGSSQVLPKNSSFLHSNASPIKSSNSVASLSSLMQSTISGSKLGVYSSTSSLSKPALTPKPSYLKEIPRINLKSLSPADQLARSKETTSPNKSQNNFYPFSKSSSEANIHKSLQLSEVKLTDQEIFVKTVKLEQNSLNFSEFPSDPKFRNGIEQMNNCENKSHEKLANNDALKLNGGKYNDINNESEINNSFNQIDGDHKRVNIKEIIDNLDKKVKQSKEIVYDLPKMKPGDCGRQPVPPVPSPSSCSTSSGYSTSNVSHSGESTRENESENTNNQNNPTEHEEFKSKLQELADKNESRARFEANRELLAKALSFEPPVSCDEPEIVETKNEYLLEKLETQKFVNCANKSLKNVDQKLNLQNRKITIKNSYDNPIDQFGEMNSDCNEYNSDNRNDNYDNRNAYYSNRNDNYRNQDEESCSSFTDDFDDEDDLTNEYLDNGVTNTGCASTEAGCESTKAGCAFTDTRGRPASSTSFYRNSVGAVNFTDADLACIALKNTFCPPVVGKQVASRSQSVPRSSGIEINPRGICDSTFQGKDGSKFSLRKSEFFRPSSPNSVSGVAASDRKGRDHLKSSSSHFLRKLLKMSAIEKFARGVRETTSFRPADKKDHEREYKKLRLQIIHPLDYNTNAVEVISRPEKISQSCEFPGVNDPLIQKALRDKAISSANDLHMLHVESSNKDKTKSRNSLRNVVKKNSFLRKRRKSEQSIPNFSEVSDSPRPEERTDLNYCQKMNSSKNYCQSSNQVNFSQHYCQNGNQVNSSKHCQNSNQVNSNKHCCQNSNQIPCNKNICQNSNRNNFNKNQNKSTNVNENFNQNVLGYNSEGKPKPPPPPRKTSLESNSTIYGNQNLFTSQSNTPSLRIFRERGELQPPKSENVKKCLLPDVLRGSQNCKPSLESRSGPYSIQGVRKMESDNVSLSSNCSSTRSIRPPPPKSPKKSFLSSALDSTYANLGNARASFTPCKPGRTGSVCGDDKRRAPEPPHGSMELTENEISRQIKNSENSRQIKNSENSRQTKNSEKLRRTSLVTNPGLPKQEEIAFSYQENLSNILEQISETRLPKKYENLQQNLTSCSQITLKYTKRSEPIFCKTKCFHEAKIGGDPVTVILSPETKMELDVLSVLHPIAIFKENIPENWLPFCAVGNLKRIGFVCVIPKLEKIETLENFVESCQKELEKNPINWERQIFQFLLQLVTALKFLQARGTEETSLESLLVIKSESDPDPQLLLFEDSTHLETDPVAVCECAARVVQLLVGHRDESTFGVDVLCTPSVPSPHIFPVLVNILKEDRSGSLTKAKCVLETALFGPKDTSIILEENVESILQNWLNQERSNLLQHLTELQSSSVDTDVTRHMNKNSRDNDKNSRYTDENSTKMDKNSKYSAKNGKNRDKNSKYSDKISENSINTRYNVSFLVRANIKSLKESLLSIQSPVVTQL